MRPPTKHRRKPIKFRGETKTVEEWSKEFGINPKTIWRRLGAGWDYTRTFTTPVKAKA